MSNSEPSSNPGESTSTVLSGDQGAGLGDEWDEDIPGEGEIELGDLSGVRYDVREQLLSPEIQEEEASYHYGQCVLKLVKIYQLRTSWFIQTQHLVT